MAVSNEILNKSFMNMTGAEILQLAKEIGFVKSKRTDAQRGSGVGAGTTPKRETLAQMKKRVEKKCEAQIKKNINIRSIKPSL